MAEVEMDYWRDDPKEWLIDEYLMSLSPEEFHGLFWIVTRSRTLRPPGVFPGDDDQLRKWSRLTKASWERSRDAVLAFFDRDENGFLHHQGTKMEYLSYQKKCYDTRADKVRAANTRYKGKKVGADSQKSPSIAPFEDPYRRFGKILGPAAGPQTQQNSFFGSKMHMHAQVVQVHAGAQPPLIDRSTERRDLSGAAPPGLSAVASPTPPNPPPGFDTTGMSIAEVGRAALAEAKKQRLSPEVFAARREDLLRGLDQAAKGDAA